MVSWEYDISTCRTTPSTVSVLHMGRIHLGEPMISIGVLVVSSGGIPLYILPNYPISGAVLHHLMGGICIGYL